MPTYQYSCTECGHFFEAVQSFSDDSLTVCPECSGRLRKVFNAVGVVFKGSGFYRNDSRSPAGGSTTGDAGSDSGTPKTEPKTEPKTAAKTAASGSGAKSESKATAAAAAD